MSLGFQQHWYHINYHFGCRNSRTHVLIKNHSSYILILNEEQLYLDQEDKISAEKGEIWVEQFVK